MACRSCGSSGKKKSSFQSTQPSVISTEAGTVTTGAAAIGVPDGDMPGLPAAWLDPAAEIEPKPWFTREIKDGNVRLSVVFPNDPFRRLTVTTLEKVITTTDRAVFAQAYPDLFKDPTAPTTEPTEG